MKKVLLILSIIVLLFTTVLVYYYQFFLQDEYNLIVSNHQNLFKSIDVVSGDLIAFGDVLVLDYEENTCILSYCFLNDCSYELDSLNCDKLVEQKYQGMGKYKVTLKFAKNKFPFSNKRFLTTWSLEPLEESVISNGEMYILGLKDLFEEFFIWEIYSVPLKYQGDTIGEVFIPNKNFSFTDDYSKAVFLLSELYRKSGDEGLREIFEKEILYLNENVDDIIEQNQNSLLYLPGAYILKLIDMGMSERYLSLIENFVLEEYTERDMLEARLGEIPLSFGKEIYSKEYLEIVHYSDYYRIFKEYGMKDLAEYSYNKMAYIYNNSDYVVYGLCSIAYSDSELVSPKDLASVLDGIFKNNNYELIEGNLNELLMCGLYTKREGLELSELENRIQDVVNMNLLKINETPFLVRGLKSSLDGEDSYTLFNYVLSDNLNYLIYLYE